MERSRSPNPWGSWGEAASLRWLIGMSVMLFLALLPFSNYVVAVPFVREESGWKLAFAFNAALALPPIACLIALGGAADSIDSA